MFAVGVLMQYLLLRTLPEGYVETESIFMSVAAVGSFLMACGCRGVSQSGEGRKPEASDEEGFDKRRKRNVEEQCLC